MLQKIWQSLKRWRSIPLGPIAVVYKIEHSQPVTRNAPQRLKHAALKQKRWISSIASEPGKEGSNPDAVANLVHQHGRELALVVGVGPGFGHALARRLAREGMAVIMAARNAHRLDALSAEIENEGGIALAYGCDATSEASVRDLFAKVESLHGVPDLVVYSLQSFGPGATVDVDLSAFEEGWKKNCLGSFLVARQAARSMLSRERGTIVLTGSTSSLLGRAGHLNLAVGKFGQRALAQVLARELWPKGIHVAHLVIDADINEGSQRSDGGPQSDPDHISETVVALHRQPRTAWSSEIDIRPWNENFWQHC